jgi:type I restriction enzyme R subunit
MYVDKRLDGVQAVQTLSRLNRIALGKNDTFVLDFENEPEDIYRAFKPYYEVTPFSEAADSQKLNDLAYQLLEWQIFDNNDIDRWCEIWFRDKIHLTGGEHQQLNNLFDPAKERYKALETLEQDRLRSQLMSFRNLYLFLSQIIPYQDSELEKLYAYSRALLKVLPRNADDPVVNIAGDVELKYYRLEKISEGAIDLKRGEAIPLQSFSDVGTRQSDRPVQLSALIDTLNDRFGTDFTLADQLFFDQIRETAIANDQLRQAAKVNKREDFAPVLRRHLENLFIERMDGNEQIFMQVMNNEAFQDVVFAYLLGAIYDALHTDK